MHESWEMYTIFWLENLKGRVHLEDLKVDGRITSELDWIHLAHNRDLWQALMYMVMNLWVPKKRIS
jgi:hypothetical protein